VVVCAACREAKIVERAVVNRVEPQMQATVVTIQTILQPQNKTFLHSIVIAQGRARSSDEVDRWRLFDFEQNRITYVDDVAKTYYVEDSGPPRSGQPGAAVLHTDSKKVIEGVETTQYLVRLGGYQRELWIGSPPAIPPNLFAMLNASDDGLLKLRGFPMIDHAELPYGNTKMVVDRIVIKIEQRDVPQSSLNIPGDYKEITAPAGRRPPASSPPAGQNTRAAE
jgi:hypothetical protein